MLSQNPILHARMKHIDLEIHFVWEKRVSQQLLIQHVSSLVQIVNVLTKSLSMALFLDFQLKLKVHYLPPP